MAANTYSQLTTANTFQQWLNATQYLIGVANTITNGNGSYWSKELANLFQWFK